MKTLRILLLCLLPTSLLAEVSQDRLEYELQEGQRLTNTFLLADVAWCEASTQGRVGKLAVMDVVLNRVIDPRFPNSIEEVITQKWAFECITRDVPIQRNSNTYKQAFELAQKKLLGEAPRITHATHYFNPNKVNPSWANSPQMTYLGDIGSHRFYRGY